MKHAKKTGVGGSSTAKEKKLAGHNRPRPRKTRLDAETDKVVCRFCGSDDLAPSFIKRRDARCRACFKQRYGSANRGKRKGKSAA